MLRRWLVGGLAIVMLIGAAVPPNVSGRSLRCQPDGLRVAPFFDGW